MTPTAARQRALQILSNAQGKSRGEVIKAVFDLRHDARDEDVELLRSLLQHSDDGVVASVLYSLCLVHNQIDPLMPLIRQYASGDERDSGEMPIQSMAITILGRIASQIPLVRSDLLELAEREELSDVPRKRAWQCLAEVYGVDWSSQDSEEMILNPGSAASESIRNRIRQSIK